MPAGNERSSLSEKEQKILDILRSASEGLRFTEILEQYPFSKGTFSRYLSQLVAQGQIIKKKEEDHSRATYQIQELKVPQNTLIPPQWTKIITFYEEFGVPEDFLPDLVLLLSYMGDKFGEIEQSEELFLSLFYVYQNCVWVNRAIHISKKEFCESYVRIFPQLTPIALEYHVNKLVTKDLGLVRVSQEIWDYFFHVKDEFGRTLRSCVQEKLQKFVYSSEMGPIIQEVRPRELRETSPEENEKSEEAKKLDMGEITETVLRWLVDHQFLPENLRDAFFMVVGNVILDCAVELHIPAEYLPVEVSHKTPAGTQTEKIRGFCKTCGEWITWGEQTCSYCRAPVDQDSLIADCVEARQRRRQYRVEIGETTFPCPHCGFVLQKSWQETQCPWCKKDLLIDDKKLGENEKELKRRVETVENEKDITIGEIESWYNKSKALLPEERVNYKQKYDFDPADDWQRDNYSRLMGYQKYFEMPSEPDLATAQLRITVRLQFVNHIQKFLIGLQIGSQVGFFLLDEIKTKWDIYLDSQRCNERNPIWEEIEDILDADPVKSPPWENFKNLVIFAKKIAQNGIHALNPDLVPAGFNASLVEKIASTLKQIKPPLVNESSVGIFICDKLVHKFLDPQKKKPGYQWFRVGWAPLRQAELDMREDVEVEDLLKINDLQTNRRKILDTINEGVKYFKEGPEKKGAFEIWAQIGLSYAYFLYGQVRAHSKIPAETTDDLRRIYKQEQLGDYYDISKIEEYDEGEKENEMMASEFTRSGDLGNISLDDTFAGEEDKREFLEDISRTGIEEWEDLCRGLHSAIIRKYEKMALDAIEKALILDQRCPEAFLQKGKILKSRKDPKANYWLRNAYYLDVNLKSLIKQPDFGDMINHTC